MVVIHIYGAREFFCYFVFTKTPNLRDKKWKIVYLDQCSFRKIYQRIYGAVIAILYNLGGKELVVFILMDLKFLLFCVHQDTES